MKQLFTKEMSKEEMDKKIKEMMAERQAQDEAAARNWLLATKKNKFYQFVDKPLSKEEMDSKIQEMMDKRQQQDELIRNKYCNNKKA